MLCVGPTYMERGSLQQLHPGGARPGAGAASGSCWGGAERSTPWRLTGLCARPQVGFLAQRVWGGRGLVNNTALPKDVLSSSAEAQR